MELVGLLSQVAGASLNGKGPRWQASTGASGSQTVRDSHLPGKASTPPPCTTIRFPDPFSVQLLIPVMAWSWFCFSSHCKWAQKATYSAAPSRDTATASIKCLSPEELTRPLCHFAHSDSCRAGISWQPDAALCTAKQSQTCTWVSHCVL